MNWIKLNNNKIKINDSIFNTEKENFINYISTSSMEIARKKRLLYQVQNNMFSNDITLVMTDYFTTNIIIYQTDYDIAKIYYTSDKLDQLRPIIIVNHIKDINSINYGYELIKNTDSYCFDFLHPVIKELLPNLICVGIEPDKRLIIGDNMDYTYISELKQAVTNQQKINLQGIDNKTKKYIDEILEHYPMNINYIKKLIY